VLDCVVEEATGGSLLHTVAPSGWCLANSVIYSQWWPRVWVTRAGSRYGSERARCGLPFLDPCTCCLELRVPWYSVGKCVQILYYMYSNIFYSILDQYSMSRKQRCSQDDNCDIWSLCDQSTKTRQWQWWTTVLFWATRMLGCFHHSHCMIANGQSSAHFHRGKIGERQLGSQYTLLLTSSVVLGTLLWMESWRDVL
jgi:hypothetical protein